MLSGRNSIRPHPKGKGEKPVIAIYNPYEATNRIFGKPQPIRLPGLAVFRGKQEIFRMLSAQACCRNTRLQTLLRFDAYRQKSVRNVGKTRFQLGFQPHYCILRRPSSPLCTDFSIKIVRQRPVPGVQGSLQHLFSLISCKTAFGREGRAVCGKKQTERPTLHQVDPLRKAPEARRKQKTGPPFRPENYTQPVGLGRPAILQAPLPGPEGKSS